MKHLILSVIALVSLSAQAHEGGNFGKTICAQNSDATPIKGERIAVVLQQIGQSRNYEMTVSVKPLVGERRLVLKEIAQVTTEDVMASFRSKNAHVMIYMDEQGQSWLNIRGKDVAILNCYRARN